MLDIDNGIKTLEKAHKDGTDRVLKELGALKKLVTSSPSIRIQHSYSVRWIFDMSLIKFNYEPPNYRTQESAKEMVDIKRNFTLT